MEELAARLTDPALIIAVLVSIAVFATLYTIAIPYLERGDLNKRMKAVSSERELIRARVELVARHAFLPYPSVAVEETSSHEPAAKSPVPRSFSSGCFGPTA